MRKRHLNLFSRLAVITAVCMAFVSFLPFASGSVRAAEDAKLVCFMECLKGDDVDHVKGRVTIKNCTAGDVVTAVFILQNGELSFSAFPEGIKLVSFNDTRCQLTVEVSGKSNNPNGSYTFMIAGSNIETYLVGKTVRLQGTSVKNVKPGDEGPGAGGPGAGGPGENKPGGPGEENKPGGPGDNKPGGPGEENKPGGPGENKPGENKPGENNQDQNETSATTTTTVTETTTAATTQNETTKETTKSTTAKPAETTAATEAPSMTTTLPETLEETTSEETSSTQETEAPTEAAPAVVETGADNTDPSETLAGETTAAETTVTSGMTAAQPAKSSSGSSSWIWWILLLILLIVIYLRYRHLKKKDMTFPEICKNFIPVGALVAKIKNGGKSDDTVLDGPQPEVMNGYLQKPTVGLAAAQAIRPVRSNVSQPSASKAPVKKPETEKTDNKPADAKGEPKKPATISKPPVKRSSFKTTDPELLAMEKKQAELERKMKDLSSHKEKLPGEDDVV